MTVAEGTLSEVFFPNLDEPVLHDLRFLVAASGAPAIDDAAEAVHEVTWPVPELPIFKVMSHHPEYALAQDLLVDPLGSAILLSGTFRPNLPDLRLYLVVTPHCDPFSSGNHASVREGEPPVLACQVGAAWVALVGAFGEGTVGYVGTSDLDSALRQHGALPLPPQLTAGPGNVSAGAEMNLLGGPFQVGIGFGFSALEAEDAARAALDRGNHGITEALEVRARTFPELPANLLRVAGDEGRLARCSVAVLRALEDKSERGAFVASPATAWPGAPDHLRRISNRVWPRDLYHIATALLEIGDTEPALRGLRYLARIQRPDGSWPVNCRIGGSEHWQGIELDEVALPILLAWRLGVAEVLDFDPYPDLIRRAAGFLLTHGPSTPYDRWENAGGISPSSLAAAISGLLIAAEFAEDAKQPIAAEHLRIVADYWNDRVEPWCCFQEGRVYRRLGAAVDEDRTWPGAAMEFLELTRFGVRGPDHPAVRASLKIVDQVLRCQTPVGPAWRRYEGDVYGEYDNGQPWDGGGRGRPWPLLTAERARMAVAAGHHDPVLVRSVEAFAGEEGLLPEQVWDGPAIPERGLAPGRPTGSVAPLGLAHAEYLKLLASIATTRMSDVVDPVRRRYSTRGSPAGTVVWSHAHRITEFPVGRAVRVQLPRRGGVWWSVGPDTGRSLAESRDTGLGVWIADLPTGGLAPGMAVTWTVHYGETWEGVDHKLTARND